MTRTIIRLALCVACGLILAMVTSLLYFFATPRWVRPVAELLNWPVAWVYFHIFPTMDEYPPFISSHTWLGVAMFFVLAVPVYSALLASPLAARWFIRITRRAAHTPGPFILYFLAGSVVGGMAGL